MLSQSPELNEIDRQQQRVQEHHRMEMREQPVGAEQDVARQRKDA